MNDIVKPKKDKTYKGMSLDVALKIIEDADSVLKNERQSLRPIPMDNKITKNSLSTSTGNKIGFSSIGLGSLGFYAMLSGFTAGPELFFAPLLAGLAALGAAQVIPERMEKLLCPRKYKTYTREREINTLFQQLDHEKFQAKEKEVLHKTKEALEAANSILQEQGQQIIYSSSNGFSIKSSQPLVANKWDTLRVEAIRNQGAKSIGIKPNKIKELTAKEA